MMLRIPGICLLLLSTLSFAVAQTQEATTDERAAESATSTASAAVESTEAPADAATDVQRTEPTPPAAESAPVETAAADATEESEPAKQPVAEEKKTKTKKRKQELSCEEAYAGSRLPPKNCK